MKHQATHSPEDIAASSFGWVLAVHFVHSLLGPCTQALNGFFDLCLVTQAGQLLASAM